MMDLKDTETPTVQRIYEHWKKRGDSEAPRRYLGASIIGHPCDRYLWYSFLGLARPVFSGRFQRLLDRGDLEETRFCAELRAIGVQVVDRDVNGRQIEVSAIGGHFKGHLDAGLLGLPEAPEIWHVGEFKTHNAKSFNKLKQTGVQGSKPQHWAQMQVYMHLTGMPWAAYLAVNKDTDEIYMERVPYSKEAGTHFIARAEYIISTTSKPPGLPDSAWECKYCDMVGHCRGNDSLPVLPAVQKDCRQCLLCEPIMDAETQNGLWKCHNGATDTFIPCNEHDVIPDLLNAAIGDIAIHNYSTEELMQLTPMQLKGGFLNAVKETFGGTMTVEKVFEERYPRELWKGHRDQLKQTVASLGLGGTVTCNSYDTLNPFQEMDFSGKWGLRINHETNEVEVRGV